MIVDFLRCKIKRKSNLNIELDHLLSTYTIGILSPFPEKLVSWYRISTSPISFSFLLLFPAPNQSRSHAQTCLIAWGLVTSKSVSQTKLPWLEPNTRLTNILICIEAATEGTIYISSSDQQSSDVWISDFHASVASFSADSGPC